MIIISHRGFWKVEGEKNSELAFKRALENGYGIETDIRDYNCELVISHNIPDSSCIKIETFFEIYNGYQKRPELALNIKASGLQGKLSDVLLKYGIENYFVFDMSVPDALTYLENGIRVFTRQSECELSPPFYESAHGVWLDEFSNHWITGHLIETHLKDKQVCIVSPELHEREHMNEWNHYKQIEEKLGRDVVMLCTDFPQEAEEFFNG